MQIKSPNNSNARSPRKISYSQNPNGPAEYNTSSAPTSPRAPTYKIGSRVNNDWLILNDGPSSASYSPNHDLMHHKPPAYSIAHRPEEREVEASPGPADHPAPSPFGKHALHIRSRPKADDTTISPGPAYYSPKKVSQVQAPRYTIRPLYKTVDKSVNPEILPTPRLFDKVKGAYMGNGRSRSIDNSTKTPGPAAYSPNIDDYTKTHGHTLQSREPVGHPRHRLYTTRDPPGPGEYSPRYEALENLLHPSL